MLRLATRGDVEEVLRSVDENGRRTIRMSSAKMGSHLVDEYHNPGRTWAWIEDGKAAVLVGADEQRPGMLTMWVMVGDRSVARRRAMTTVRVGRRILQQLLKHVHRVETYCLADFPEAIRLSEAIGMQREGVLRKFGINEEDAVLLSCVRE